MQAGISKKITVDPQVLIASARRIAQTLRDSGFIVLFAGGCVRDRLLGRPVSDIDIATDATPEQVEALFPRTVAVGKAFGVVCVLQEGMCFEVATFRADAGIGDGRRPAAVRFGTPEADAQRRDFTVNGMFADPFSGRILDFVGGQADLRARLIRAIGEPALRFREDRLRMLRAVRFASVLDFSIDPRTAVAIRTDAAAVRLVSAERCGSEITRLLTEAPRVGVALECLRETGLLAVLLPEVAAMQGVAQPPTFHPEGDVYRHTCHMLDALPPPPRDPVLTYAVLLHDVGKPPAAVAPPDGDPDGWRFPNHAGVGEAIAERLLARLKLPRSITETVAAMVKRHMTLPDLPQMRPARRRRFMGASFFDAECELLRLDSLCSAGDLSLYHQVMQLKAAYAAEPVLPEPWVSGRDLLAMGCAPGPAIGRWLRQAYDAQLEGRFADREALLDWVANRLRNGAVACLKVPEIGGRERRRERITS